MMLRFKSICSILCVALLVGCTNVLDKPFSADNMEAIKEELEKDQSLDGSKKMYVLDNLQLVANISKLGESMDIEANTEETAREIIADLSETYDSIDAFMHTQMDINEKISDFITLVNASTYSFDEYKGMLNMELVFKNNFNKDILYTVIEYKYTDEYDTQYFNERVKITDEIAGAFDDTVEVVTSEQYNDVATFMYKKVPVKARKSLQDELGVEEANKKVERDFLLKGFEVNCQGVVFKDKSEVYYREVDWKYLSK